MSRVKPGVYLLVRHCWTKEIYTHESSDGNEDSEKTFEDEYPCPSVFASYLIHFVDSAGEETPECTSYGGGREEDCGTEGAFATAVPEGDVVVDTLSKYDELDGKVFGARKTYREESGFCDS
jgi:hypothetical protein